MSAVPPIGDVSGGQRARVASPRGVTTLMYACQQGDVEKVRRILRAQPETTAKQDRSGKTALHYCCTSDSKCAAQAADLLVMAAPDLLESTDEDGFTPLHLAVIAGNMPLVTFLLANNADVNAVDSEKHTVVHWATVCGETGALRAVLAAGAAVSTPDVHGGYPLHYAAQMCGGDKDSSLGLQVLQTLLQHEEIKVNVEDGDGRQPLLWAASAGSAKAVLALIRAGAAVNAPDKDGLTALHCAASRGHTDCIDTLLTLCGMSPDVIDSNGCTALHYSVTLGHADATALLLTHGADPNRQDRKGRSPAHCGCAKGQFETVKMIGAHGANLWLRNARGDLPLHEASASGRRDLVKWLLEARPSQVNARNNDGRCPLHLAALNDNSDMCKILLDAGAHVNPVLRTSKNTFMTPLDCALQRGFRSTAKYLQLHGGVPASRLSSTKTLPNGTANLHIREELTLGETTDSEREGEEKEERLKKRHRKKMTYKYERKKTISSGREGEGSEKKPSSSAEKEQKRDKSSKRRPSAEKGEKKSEKEQKSKENITYSSEVKITNNYGGINIEKNGEIIISDGSPIMKTESGKMPTKTKTETSINLPDIAKEASTVKLTESTKISVPETAKDKEDYKMRSGEKTTDTPAKTVSENIEEIKSLASTIEQTAKSITEEVVQIQQNLEIGDLSKQKQQDQFSYTSPDESEHRELIVEAAVHPPPKSPLADKTEVLKEIEEQVLQSTSEIQKVGADDKQEEQKETPTGDLEITPDHEAILGGEEYKKEDTEMGEDLAKADENEKDEEEQFDESKIAMGEQEEEEGEERYDEEPEETGEVEQEEEEGIGELEEEEGIGKVEKEDKIIEKAEKSEDRIKEEEEREEDREEGIAIKDMEGKEEKIEKEKGDDEVGGTKAEIGPPELEEIPQVADVHEVVDEEEDKSEQVEQQELETKKEIIPEADVVVKEPEESVLQEAEEPILEETKKDVDEPKQAKPYIEEIITSKEDASDISISTPDTVKLVEKASIQEEEEEGVVEPKEVVEEPEPLKKEKDTCELLEGDLPSKEIEKDTSPQEDVVTKPEIEDREKDVQVAKTKKVEREKIKEAEKLKETEGVVSEKLATKDKADAKQKKILKGKRQKHVEETPRITPKQDKTKPMDSMRDKKLKVIKKDKPKRAVKATAKEEKDKTRNKEKMPKKAIEKVLEVTNGGISEVKTTKRTKDEVKIKSKKKISRKSSEERTSDEEVSTSSESNRRRKHKSFTILDEIKGDDQSKKKSKIPTPVSNLRRDFSKSDRYLDRMDVNGSDGGISLPNLQRGTGLTRRFGKAGSAYSDNDKSASDIEEGNISAARRRRLKKRMKRDSRSAGSDYESSNLIDSGFEPSPRSTKIPRWRNMSDRGVNMTSVTQTIQSNIRRYHLERKVFQHLLELKRLQIRSGQHNEAVLVKRAIDDYHNSCASTVGAGMYVPEDYSFKSFEKFLYNALRKLQKSDEEHLRGLPETPDNPLLCTRSTHRCLHATHAYTGIPCAAYLPQMDHHTIPKIGYPCKPQGFLPHIHPKKTVTLELLHGNDKQVISLPTDKLDQNKRYYVTFTVKGQEPTSPKNGVQKRDEAHRHAKSV